MKGQPREQSWLEACVNVGIGYSLSVAVQPIILGWYDLQISLTDDLGIALLFTVISLVRSYGLRRAFNALQVWQQKGERE